MIRPTPTVSAAGEFRLRGKDVSRLEALSDGVFALAMTLLIVSVEVPGSFDELLRVLRGVPAFAACFAILIWFWITHHRFFRRYGLNDGMTVFLNSALLFLVLLYVYPLKFLFSLFLAVMGRALSGSGLEDLSRMMPHHRQGSLFALYSAGFGLIWLVFALMNVHAYRQRRDLELSAVERLLTRAEIGRCLALTALASLSILIAATASGFWLSSAGWIYVLIGPMEWAHGASVGRRKARLLRAATQSSGPPSGTAHPPPG